jgi:hypothetical protein
MKAAYCGLPLISRFCWLADQGQVLPAARQRGRFAGKDWDIADPQADRELDFSEPEQLTFQYRSEIEQLRSLPIRTAAETDSSRSIGGPHSSFLVANLGFTMRTGSPQIPAAR